MEQSLIPSSRYKITSVSVDTRFADQHYNNDTTDFMIRLPETMKNVMRIRLSSVEIPSVEYTFTVAKGNVAGTVVDSTGTRVFTIEPGNYTVATLCSAVETRLGVGYACSANPITGLVSITKTSGEFTLYLGSDNSTICSRKTHWGIGYYLGFRVPYVQTDTLGNSLPEIQRRSITSSGSTATAYAPPLVTQNTYYLMQLQCPDQLDTVVHRVAGNAGIPAFAKLTLKNNGVGIDYDDNSDLIRKEYTFLAPTNISQLRVKLLDAFGVPVQLRTADWSMTFELTEIVNSHTYDKLNKTFTGDFAMP
jgi:hypothetical protein